MSQARTRLFRGLEGVGGALRRAGLGPVVGAGRRVLERRMGEMEVSVDGLRLGGSVGLHMHYLRELETEGREVALTRLFKEAIRPGATVVDVGAHLGYLTLQAARAVGPRGHVYAVEPNPETLPRLRRNLERNGCADRVTVLPVALADRAQDLDFHLAPSGDGSSLFPQAGTRDRSRVRAATADDVLAGVPPVGVVKIDVEGAELQVLAGMERTLRRAAPELVVFVECNPEALRRAGASPRALVERLRELGLRPQLIDEETGSLRELPDLDGVAGYANLRCDRGGP